MNFLRCDDMFIRLDKIQAIERDWEDASIIYLDKKLKLKVDASPEDLVKMIDELESKNDRTKESNTEH